MLLFWQEITIHLRNKKEDKETETYVPLKTVTDCFKDNAAENSIQQTIWYPAGGDKNLYSLLESNLIIFNEIQECRII